MNNANKSSHFFSVLAGCAAAFLVYLLTDVQYNPYIENGFSPLVHKAIAVAFGAIFAAGHWGYSTWKHDFVKIRLFLAPLAGLIMGGLTYYLSAPNAEHWTIYNFMNLMQPSLAVQRGLTMVNFAMGVLLMLVLGSRFFRLRFFVAFTGGGLMFLFVGWAMSYFLLPVLTGASWLGKYQDPALKIALSSGLSVAIFFGAWVFYFAILEIKGTLIGRDKPGEE